MLLTVVFNESQYLTDYQDAYQSALNDNSIPLQFCDSALQRKICESSVYGWRWVQTFLLQSFPTSRLAMNTFFKGNSLKTIMPWTTTMKIYIQIASHWFTMFTKNLVRSVTMSWSEMILEIVKQRFEMRNRFQKIDRKFSFRKTLCNSTMAISRTYLQIYHVHIRLANFDMEIEFVC